MEIPSPIPSFGKDPVCYCIEAGLRQLEQRGCGHLERADADPGIRLKFGRAHATSISYEIALIRLATFMVGDLEYGEEMRNALGEQLEQY